FVIEVGHCSMRTKRGCGAQVFNARSADDVDVIEGQADEINKTLPHELKMLTEHQQ
ncbi:hypothetical protein Bpfe_028034, partial [Biomphalaria pfeifferi]